MAKIEKCESLKVADRVLAALRKATKKDVGSVTVKTWSNGREQGYALIDLSGHPTEWKVALVAESRGSDDILVVMGPYSEFDYQSHMPSDKIWDSPENRVHLRPGQYDAAARKLRNFFW